MFNKKEYDKRYYHRNKVKRREYLYKWLKLHPDRQKEYRKKWKEKKREKINEYNRNWKKTSKGKEYKRRNNKTLASKFYRYKNSAKRRKLEFSISRDEFEHLILSSCYYCGFKPDIFFDSARPEAIPAEKGIIPQELQPPAQEARTNGVDRVDNKVGYKKENCVSCCAMCNKMKWTFNQKDFINQCKKIVNKLTN